MLFGWKERLNILRKKKYKVLAGAAVILLELTAALVLSIRNQPDPGI